MKTPLDAHRQRRDRGVSLVEAMVALAVMAIGMLGLVGMQSTLRSNADLSKQRSEAVRLAQEAVEGSRAFVTLNGGAPAYSGVVYAQDTVAGSSATFTRTRNVSVLPGPVEAKTLVVTVTWPDRAGQQQSVTLDTVIAGIAPELAATLAVPGEGGTTRQPQGRNRNIPLLAQQLPDAPGMSAMIPPGASGIAWRFDNVTGLITLCNTSAATTSALTYANLTSCNGNALLLSGYVRYEVGVPPAPGNPPDGPTSSQLFLPWVDYTNAATTGRQRCYLGNTDPRVYYCAVPVVATVPSVPPSWSGMVHFDNDPASPNLTASPPTPNPPLATTLADDSSANYKICRYQASGYSGIDTPLINQNFLVISAGDKLPFVVTPGTVYSCPAPTVAHQPS